MDGAQRTYAYNLKWWVYIPLILVCGYAVVFARSQAQKDLVVEILGIFTLSPENSRIFYLAATGICALALFLVCFVGIKSYATPRVVSLRYTTMLAPKNLFSWEEVSIEYRNILKVTPIQYQVWRALEIKHTGGKFRLMEVFLGRKAFREIGELLTMKALENAHTQAPRKGR